MNIWKGIEWGMSLRVERVECPVRPIDTILRVGVENGKKCEILKSEIMLHMTYLATMRDTAKATAAYSAKGIPEP